MNLKRGEIRGKLRGYFDSLSKNNEILIKVVIREMDREWIWEVII